MEATTETNTTRTETHQQVGYDGLTYRIYSDGTSEPVWPELPVWSGEE